MERPSHFDFRASHPCSSRLVLSALAISLPLAVLWALTLGTVAHFIRDPGPLVFVPDSDTVKPKPPPPLPPMIDLPRIKVVPPDFKFDPQQQQKDDTVTATANPPADNTQAAQSAGPDQAAVAIATTHTRPPYPLLAQRIGAEGKVILRLTVLPDGRVGKADIVTSSGRSDLDDSARDWIVTHWAWRPALDKGEPVASQTLVTVTFSLSNQR